MSCRIDIRNCSDSSTASIVSEFANNNTEFLITFGSAFQVLIENGYPDGILFTATDNNGADGGQRAAGSFMLISSIFVFIFTFV